MSANTACGNPNNLDGANLAEIRIPRILIPLSCSSPQSTTSSSRSSTPMSTSRSGSDKEVRELDRVLRRMQAVDQRYWEQSRLLLLRNEIALQALQATAQPTLQEEVEDQTAEPMAGSNYLPDSETEEEERVMKQRCDSVVDSEVGREAAVERFSGAVNDAYRRTPVHIQELEGRIIKARSDLSILEQHSRYVETEMKRLQEEHVKLNEQLRRAEFQFDDLLREQQTYLTESFKLYHRQLLNREALRQDLREVHFQLTLFNQYADFIYQ